MAQFARPDSDISAGPWLPQGSSAEATLWASVDETSPDDGVTYIEDLNGGNGTCELGLTTITDPAVSTGHILRFRMQGTGSGAPERCEAILFQGATQIATTGIQTSRGAWATKTYTLSAGEADAITDYSDLRVKLTSSDLAGGADPEDMWVTWVEFEVPDASADVTGAASVTGSGLVSAISSVDHAASATVLGSGLVSAVGSLPIIWAERWEDATDTDETWDTKVETSGTVDDNFDVTGVAGWWGSEGMECDATAGQGAFRNHDLGTSQSIVYLSCDLSVSAVSLASDLEAFTIIDAYDDTAVAAGDQVFSVLLQRESSGVYRFVFQDFRDDTSNTTAVPSAYFEIGKPYRLQIKWDKTAGNVAFSLDWDEYLADTTITSSRGGVQVFRVGCQSVPTSGTATILFDNFTLRSDKWEWPLKTKDPTTEIAVWAERHEATGYDMPWTDPEVEVASGNSMDSDAATSGISAPANWGDTALKTITGATASGVVTRNVASGPIGPVAYISMEFYLESDSSANSTDMDLFFLKRTTPPDADVGVCNPQLFKDSSGTRNIQLDIGASGILKTCIVSDSIATGVFHKIEVKIDMANYLYEFWFDGHLRMVGAILTAWSTAWGDLIGVYVEGSSSGSSALNYTLWYDNFLISERGWATDTAVVVPFPPWDRKVRGHANSRM